MKQDHNQSLAPNRRPTQLIKRAPKWLKCYHPTVNASSSEYHFVSQPQIGKHQKVSIKSSQSSRPILMYFEVQDLNAIKKHMHNLREDTSGLKDFSYIQHIQKQPQTIILNKQQTIKDSMWAIKYQPKAFYQLLTDQTHNRNVLSWLKSWDKIVFHRDVPQMTPNPNHKFVKTIGGTNYNTHNNNNNNSSNNNGNKNNSSTHNNNNNNNSNNTHNNNNNNNVSNNHNNNPNYNSNNSHNGNNINKNGQKYQSNNYKPYSQYVQDFTHNKLLLLSGPPGCGKTTLARVLAKHCGYDISQINASDDRSAKTLIAKIQALGKTNSIQSGKPILIVVDEVDGALEQDGNGIKQVLTFIQNGGKPQKHKQQQPKPRPQDLPKTQYVHREKHSIIPRPIIFICNDPFVKGLKELRSKATVVYFRLAQKQRVVKRLKQITQKQKVYIENQVLIKIAQISNCDIRGSLSILQYICQAKRVNNQNPKELISKLRLSFSKDSNTSIIEFINGLLNQTKMSHIKQMVNIKQFSHKIHKIDNMRLLLQTFYHNFIGYKNFFVKGTKESIKLYDWLAWTDVVMNQSFRYNNQLDSFVMMPFLYYRMTIINQQLKKTQFPIGFFQKLSRLKHNKQVVSQLVDKWPTLLRSVVSINTVVKEYLYLLYYSVQTSSPKDNQIVECVSKMITYNIHLAPRNAYFLFKPEFDALLTFSNKKLQVNYSNISRTLIQESYEFAKTKSYLLADLSLTQLNKNTEQLLSQLHIKNKRRKRNPQSMMKNTIKYKFIQGSGTQTTYDLKFKFFFNEENNRKFES